MLRHTKVSRRLVVATAVALLLAACGGGGRGGGGQATQESSPGITDTEVKLGTSLPFSGPGSAYGTIANSAEAWFKVINERGGVKSADGKTRKITYLKHDDAWQPPRTVENVRRLVEQDQVFAIFQTLGTAPNTAIYDYLNQQAVPQVFIATGASKWGANWNTHPWTIGWQIAYTTEMAIYTEYIKKQKPGGARVAFLYQNDDFGKDLLAGFRHAIAGTNIQLAATQSYELTDATVDSQVVNLQSSGADVFMNTGQSKQASQAIKKAAELGWKPLQVIGSFSSSVKAVIEPAGLDNAQGLVTGIYLKDPTDAQWANDPGVKEYREVLAKHCSSCNPDDSLNVSGLMYAKTMVAALEGMKAPTRQAFMDSVKNLDISGGVLLDGVKIKTGPKDGYPIEAVVMGVFKGRNWELQGQVIDLEGKTPIVKE